MAMIGSGAVFAAEAVAGGGSYTNLAGVTHITPPATTVDSVDVTDMDSAEIRAFIPGLTDPGELGLDLNWTPSSSTDDFIYSWIAAREARSCRITFDNGITWTFSGFPTNYAPDAPMDDKMTAQLTIKASGSVVRT